MRTQTIRAATLFRATAIIAVTTSSAAAQCPLVLQSAAFFGGAGEQQANGIAIAGGSIYLCGTTNANAVDGLVAMFTVPPGAAPAWNTPWPVLSGGDQFSGIGVSAEGVYLAGDSYGRTVDSVGGKENKCIAVKFPLAGPPGGGFGGAIWDRQVPNPPGALAYGGGENLRTGALAIEGGLPYFYVGGSGQSSGSNGGRSFVSKLDSAGNIVWTVTDASVQVGVAYSTVIGMTTFGGNLYVVGTTGDSGTGTPYIRKFLPTNAQVWSRTSAAPGYFSAVAPYGADLIAAGTRSAGMGGSTDFLIERWDASGNLVWSRQFDRSSADDQFNGLVTIQSRIYAVGSTRGGTAGGSDAIVLAIDPLTGSILSSTLYGGSLDDTATCAATDGTDLYVAGASKSFGNGANPIGSNDAMLLRYIIATTCRADFNSDGVASVQDLFDFLGVWFAGCH